MTQMFKWDTYHSVELKERYHYKFLSEQWLEAFLNSGNIWFSRADQFGDKMECVRISDLLTSKPDYDAIEKRKRKFLISCWHLADNESIAFWDTYSDRPENRRNYAIRFKRTQLQNLFNRTIFKNNNQFYKTKWIHGKVQYRNLINLHSNTLNQVTVKFPAFRKELSFSYENEYRFVIELDHETPEMGINYNLGSSINLPFDILINPLLTKNNFQNAVNTIKRMGFEDRLKDSSLTKWFRPDRW